MFKMTFDARKAPAVLSTPEEPLTTILPGFFANGLPAGLNVTELVVRLLTLNPIGV